MTARCLPDVQSFESDAERVVWQALRDQLPDDAVLWSNLALSDRKGDSEADLVVLWPGVGVATVEVKGGHITRDVDGSWVQVHRDGRRSPIDPVRPGPAELAMRCGTSSASTPPCTTCA